ncbi:unnamed protein product, partial [Ectocarpus sp. 4 AP-2014]
PTFSIALVSQSQALPYANPRCWCLPGTCMPLKVVYEGQRCGFFADIECYTPTTMTPADVDTLKGAIVRHVNDAYFSRGFESAALLWSENHRGNKLSFHVIGRDVDFEGTYPRSDLAHVANNLNCDCLELTKEYPLVNF